MQGSRCSPKLSQPNDRGQQSESQLAVDQLREFPGCSWVIDGWVVSVLRLSSMVSKSNFKKSYTSIKEISINNL